jgi:hypothetical protein
MSLSCGLGVLILTSAANELSTTARADFHITARMVVAAGADIAIVAAPVMPLGLIGH